MITFKRLASKKQAIRRLFLCCITASCALLMNPAFASLYCTGTISIVYIQHDGAVVIDGTWRGHFTQICNIHGTFGGIDEKTCLAWYGAALMAISTQSTVTVNYLDDNSYSCSTLPIYGSAPVPNYFMIKQ